LIRSLKSHPHGLFRVNAWRFIMNKFTTLTAAGASALLLSLSAGAFAATAQPDAGNQPFASIDMSQSGTLQRSAVEAAAIRNAPAAASTTPAPCMRPTAPH